MGETKTKYKSKMHKKNNTFQPAQTVPNSIDFVPALNPTLIDLFTEIDQT
jgi:hypothetical protein